MMGRALPGPYDCEQIPELAGRGKLRLRHFLGTLDAHLLRWRAATALRPAMAL